MKGFELTRPIRICRPLAMAILAGMTFWPLMLPARGESLLTVLSGYDQWPDTSAMDAMQRETAELFTGAGVTFSWQQNPRQSFIQDADLAISVRFHGKCRLEPGEIVLPSDGPMAFIAAQDGEIRPTIDVDCDRTAAMVWQTRGTLSFPLVSRAFGRALGRVMAHELYHYLTQSPDHTHSELFRRAMTSSDLTRPQARFEAGEIEALRKGMAKLGARD